MTALSAWYDLVLPDVRGVTQELALYEIRQAVIEFCEQSQAMNYVVPAMDTVADTHTYTPTPEANTLIVDVLSVKLSGLVLEAKDKRWLDDNIRDWTTETGVPAYWYRPAPDTVRLVRTPADATTAGLEIEIAHRPTDAATTVDDRLWRQHSDDIKIGAIGRLLMMDGKPWTNPQKAARYQSDFISAIHAAAGMRGRGLTKRVPLRVRSHA